MQTAVSTWSVIVIDSNRVESSMIIDSTHSNYYYLELRECYELCKIQPRYLVEPDQQIKCGAASAVQPHVYKYWTITFFSLSLKISHWNNAVKLWFTTSEWCITCYIVSTWYHLGLRTNEKKNSQSSKYLYEGIPSQYASYNIGSPGAFTRLLKHLVRIISNWSAIHITLTMKLTGTSLFPLLWQTTTYRFEC